jgi:hypothetical protein
MGYKVLTAIVMNSAIFWDITPCSSLKFNLRFGGKYCLHLQDWRINQVWNQRETRLQAEQALADCFQAGFLLGLFFEQKIGVIYSSEISVDFQRSTRRYIPEDSTLIVQDLWS